MKLLSSPGNYTWKPWTPWSACSKTCMHNDEAEADNTGTRCRVRLCVSPINGQQCPDKKKALIDAGANVDTDLNTDYKMCENCTALTTCTSYYPGQWMAWSSCSTTCGKVWSQSWQFDDSKFKRNNKVCLQGVMTRERRCFDIATMQAVANSALCSSGDAEYDKGHMKQEKSCKLQECPGWSEIIEDDIIYI